MAGILDFEGLPSRISRREPSARVLMSAPSTAFSDSTVSLPSISRLWGERSIAGSITISSRRLSITSWKSISPVSTLYT